MPIQPGGPSAPPEGVEEVGRDIQDIEKQRERDEARRLGKNGGCAHALCDCDDMAVSRDGNGFCSERCAEIETSGPAEMKCSCGHSTCVPP
jgi:hypothetical protein